MKTLKNRSEETSNGVALLMLLYVLRSTNYSVVGVQFEESKNSVSLDCTKSVELFILNVSLHETFF